MPPQIIHILRYCGRLAAPDFVTKCIEARAVRWPEVWKFYGSLTLLHFPTGGTNDAHNVSADTARGKDNDQQNFLIYIFINITTNTPTVQISANAHHSAKLCIKNVYLASFYGFFQRPQPRIPKPVIMQNTSNDVVPHKDVPFRS